MIGSLDDLSFAAWPPAIDISTPANPQSFNPQFSVANTGSTETISLTRALLLVPVTTKGTNLALNTDMVPNNITSGWSFSHATTPPGDEGYAAFELLPDDGEGAIPPGGSVAFMLTGVKVNTAVGTGTATLRLEAKTSAGLWTQPCPIQLTTPGTTPTITRYSITPADPQTLSTLEGQPVVISWTTTGAAYCTIVDDQGNEWSKLPTSGTLADTPAQGDSPVLSTAKLGRYYIRTYRLYANSSGAGVSDDRPDDATIRLPTIFSFAASPASIAPGQSVTVSWSVGNIDPDLGTIALSLDPSDGTGLQAIAIPLAQTSGSGVLTPTPQTTTAYALNVDNGYGTTFSWPPQPVASPLQPGWQEMHGLETLSHGDTLAPFGLVAFADQLWCWVSNPPGLYRTVDGTDWTAVTPSPALPPLDTLIVADLGDGEKLWAFGGAPFLASSSDGIHWDTKATPAYPGRTFGNYVAGDGTILVLGGQDGNSNPITDVWSTNDGGSWTKVGNDFPGFTGLATGDAVARFAGALQTLRADTNALLWSYNSSDGGKTWSRAATAISQSFYADPSLMPVGGVVLVFGFTGLQGGMAAMVMDPVGTWSFSASLSPPTSNAQFGPAAVHQGCLWLMARIFLQQQFQFFRVNQVLPGTVFALTPTGNSSSD